MKRLLVMIAIAAAASCSNDNSPTEPSNDSGNQAKFTVDMSAANEVPPTTGAEANAKGTANITFNLGRDGAGNITSANAVFEVTLSGFSPTSVINIAHIHPGATGQNGTVLVNTTLAPGDVTLSSSGSGSFTKANISFGNLSDPIAIMANPSGYYFNVHTALNPTGAIRGQLVRVQ
jgi:hypothetical protein